MLKTMKAALVIEFGEPMTIGELTVPEPVDGEVLISGSRPAASATPMSTPLASTSQVGPRRPSRPGTQASGAWWR